MKFTEVALRDEAHFSDGSVITGRMPLNETLSEHDAMLLINFTAFTKYVTQVGVFQVMI